MVIPWELAEFSSVVLAVDLAAEVQAVDSVVLEAVDLAEVALEEVGKTLFLGARAGFPLQVLARDSTSNQFTSSKNKSTFGSNLTAFTFLGTLINIPDLLVSKRL